mmetsp:Transcript_73411/g.207371  ORF Transcript_73411/g.207371 Transcript_73411/m.207371 type:complete len:208 (+) Transcript_73411:31-654(+)
MAARRVRRKGAAHAGPATKTQVRTVWAPQTPAPGPLAGHARGLAAPAAHRAPRWYWITGCSTGCNTGCPLGPPPVPVARDCGPVLSRYLFSACFFCWSSFHFWYAAGFFSFHFWKSMNFSSFTLSSTCFIWPLKKSSCFCKCLPLTKHLLYLLSMPDIEPSIDCTSMLPFELSVSSRDCSSSTSTLNFSRAAFMLSLSLRRNCCTWS